MVRVEHAATAEQIADARALIAEYEKLTGQDLSYQGLQGELADLPGVYAPPAGRLLLAYAAVGAPADLAAGVVALRPWPELGPWVCEMKRLYVRSTARGQGVGAALVDRLLAEARDIGYRRMVLDTLPEFAGATRLYMRAGFEPRERYNDDPHPETEYYELDLTR